MSIKIKEKNLLISLFLKPLTLCQRTNFRLFHTERVCRRQFQIWQKWQKVLQMGWKHCGKRRNCSLRAISSFPTVFLKDLYCRHLKTRVCLGKGLTHILDLERLWKKISCKNKVGKGENAGNQHFLLVPLCFLPLSKHISIYQPLLLRRLQLL